MRLRNINPNFENKFSLEDYENLKVQNPEGWRRLKNKFDIGRQIVQVQLLNGIDRLNENTIRDYLAEYAGRFLSLGLKSFPTSFNVLEPFFTFNANNIVLQMIDEEESYGISLVDFLDFVTEKEFDLLKIDFLENIPEKIIYHFDFTSSLDEINFSNTKGKTFHIASLSLVRQGNEVSILMEAGESYDIKEANEYFKGKTNETIAESIRPDKKAIGLRLTNDKEQPKVIPLQEREDLWLHTVGLLFDLETKTVDLRFVARDENITYNIFTDDFHAIFSGQDELSETEIKESYENHLNDLSKYDAVFDFAKYCLALPFYIFENEDKLIDVNYETSLNKILKGPLSKKEYSSVPSKYKLFAKPFYYLESNSQTMLKSRELHDDSFKIDKSGYWKRISINEEGFDKKGRIILGKTWVERSDVYFTSSTGVTKIEEVKLFDSENAGFIYIMRQPAHEENIFKVGRTKRNTEIRSKELSNTSTIDKFFIINKYQTKDCVLAENTIHKSLERFRISERREFFSCELKIILETCEKIINDINYST